MAIHDIDLARWYLESEADELWAIGGAYGHKEFDEINDAETGAAMVKFKMEQWHYLLLEETVLMVII